MVLASIDVIHVLFDNKVSEQLENTKYIGNKTGFEIYLLPQRIPHNTCIIGYRGKRSGIDSGVIYSPFRFLIGVDIQTESYNTEYTHFITRYALSDKTDIGMLYYRKINMTYY